MKGAGRAFLTVTLLLAASLHATTDGGRLEVDLRDELEKRPETLPVFILLAEQSALDESSWHHEAGFEKKRWRAEVIEQLRTLADRSQRALLAELEQAGHHGNVVARFWIVNGLSVELTPAGVEWMAASPRVARVYLRTEKPADLIATEGKYTRSFEQPAPGIVSIGQVLAHQDLPWNLKSIQADLVWKRLGLIGRGVVVAVMDSGVNYRHEDFRHHLWRNEGEIERNQIDDDGNGYIDDIYGFNFANGNGNIEDDFFHGNASASVIMGDGRDGMLTGVAPGALLMTLRVYDQRTRHDNSALWQAFQYDAFEAFQYALVEGADVINMSLSWEAAEKPLHAAWRYAARHTVAAGVVVVAGSGNWRGDYATPDQIRPPASVPGVLAIGGVLEDGSLPPLSSRGPVTWAEYPPFHDYPLPEGVPDVVAVSAPWGDFPVVDFRLRGYDVLSHQAGSSLTSPHVAGVVALMLEQYPQLMPDQIRDRLRRSSLDIGEIGDDPYTGAGLIQAYDAIMLGNTPLPRLSAVRFRPQGGDLLHPGSDVIVELDVENPGAVDHDSELRLLGTGEAVSIAEPTERVATLGERNTARFQVAISSAAKPGSSVPMTLAARLSVAGRRELHFDLPIWGSRVLLVDDDGGGFYERAWRQSLQRQTIAFDDLSYWPAPRAPLPALERYDAVVWIKGEESYATLSAEEQSRLSGYLSGGKGRLVLVGQNIARDLAGSELLRALGAEYVEDSVRPDRLIGAAGSPFAGIDLPYATGATRPDAVRPTGGGLLLLPVEKPEGAGVAVGRAGGVLVTIEVGGIADPADLDSLVCRLLGPSCDRAETPRAVSFR